MKYLKKYEFFKKKTTRLKRGDFLICKTETDLPLKKSANIGDVIFIDNTFLSIMNIVVFGVKPVFVTNVPKIYSKNFELIDIIKYLDENPDKYHMYQKHYLTDEQKSKLEPSTIQANNLGLL